MSGPITITIREGRDGLDIAEADYAGRRITATSRNGATMKLARALVEAGAPDGPVEARGADGRLRFTVRSLHALARHTIKARDAGGLRLERYQDRPDFLPGKPQDGVSGSGRPVDALDQKAA